MSIFWTSIRWKILIHTLAKGWKVLNHPSYSSDLSSYDLRVFSPLKKVLKDLTDSCYIKMSRILAARQRESISWCVNVSMHTIFNSIYSLIHNNPQTGYILTSLIFWAIFPAILRTTVNKTDIEIYFLKGLWNIFINDS